MANLITKLVQNYRTHKKIWLGGFVVLILIVTAAIYFYFPATTKAPVLTTRNTEENEQIHDVDYSENVGQVIPSESVTGNTPQSGNSSSTSIRKQPVDSPTSSNDTSNNRSSSDSLDTDNSNSSPGSIPPATPETASATVAFYADSQTDTDGERVNHQRVINYILQTSANPVFHAGDLMEDGTQASLTSFNDVTATLRSSRAFYSALGNNDRNGGDTANPSPLYLSNFEYPNNERWFSVNVGNLHLVVLDSSFAANNSTQLTWLESDLKSTASTSRITGVMYHHPTGTLASNIANLLRDNGVDFVITGHIHTYGHTVTNGIHYFTLSGQPSIGYILANVFSDRISLSIRNENNTVLDTITFNNR